MRSQTLLHAHDDKRRPMPNDFPEKARIMSWTAVMRYYQAGYNAVWRWYEEAGLTMLNARDKNMSNKIRAIPPEFENDAWDMLDVDLIKKYNANHKTIQKWRKELGIQNPRAHKESGNNMCKFRRGIDCTSGDRKCRTCGWNPEEHRRRLDILKSGGIQAVKKYLNERLRKEWRVGR